MKVKVRIKKLVPEAVIPRYKKVGDAGLDLVAVTAESDDEHNVTNYGTGLSVEIPEGYVGLIFPRSSIFKTVNRQANCVGVIDSGYRGELVVKHELSTTGVQLVQSWKIAMATDDELAMKQLEESIDKTEKYEVGDRVGQLIIMPYPKVDFEEVEELSSSDRGTGGFGSTGK